MNIIDDKGNQLPASAVAMIKQAKELVNLVMEKGVETQMVMFTHNKDGVGVLPIHEWPPGLVPIIVTPFLAKIEADACLFMCEGYTLPEEEAKKRAEGNDGFDSIKDNPQHYEVVFMIVETHEGNWHTESRFIGEGKDRKLANPEFAFKNISDGVQKGRFRDFLPAKGVEQPAEEGNTAD